MKIDDVRHHPRGINHEKSRKKGRKATSRPYYSTMSATSFISAAIYRSTKQRVLFHYCELIYTDMICDNKYGVVWRDMSDLSVVWI